jgi:DNA-binding transcriptional LysR family regulator
MYPEVRIDIRDMDSAAIARDLEREQADVGIGTLPKIDGMNRVELFSDPFGVVCRKDHSLAQNWDQLSWQDMDEYVLIANGLCKLITDPGFAPILDKSRLMVRNTTSLMGLVREGVGITILPRLAVTGPQDNIAFLPLKDVNTKRTVHLVSQPQNFLMPAARAFLKLITSMMHEGALGVDKEI